MSASFETTAAMNPSADPPAEHEHEVAEPVRAASGVRARRAERASVSPNVVIGVMGGLLAALLSGIFALLVWQFNSLGDSIDNQSVEMRTEIGGLRTEMKAEIGGLRTEMRTEIGGLRTEMQAGFREVNATLLDHTDRLARLETAVGLARIEE